MERSDSENTKFEETSRERDGKAPLLGSVAGAGIGYKRSVAVFDLIFRLGAAAAALTATIIMGTAGQTLPFFTQLYKFEASYDDLPTSTFFVVALSIVAGYLVLSFPFSIFFIAQPFVEGPRSLVIVFDTVSLTLVTAAAASSTAIVYLAHNGNSGANWPTICLQFTDFCQKISGGVVASLIAAVLLVFLVTGSAVAIKMHNIR